MNCPHRFAWFRMAGATRSTLLSLVTVLGMASLQGQTREDGIGSGFYVTIQPSVFSGTSYPNQYEASLATGNAVKFNSYFAPQTFQSARLTFGPGFAVGWQTHSEWFVASLEVAYAWISHPDGSEQLLGSHFISDTSNGNSNMSHQLFLTSFSQTSRKNSEWDIRVILGILPFSDLDLCFYASYGLGHGWQSFHSSATEYAESRGYIVSNAGGVTWYDMGDYVGGGDWSRSTATHSFGFGAEMFLSTHLSVRLDYKLISASYTRDHVAVFGTPYVTYYRDGVEYSYTFANVISFGLTYSPGL